MKGGSETGGGAEGVRIPKTRQGPIMTTASPTCACASPPHTPEARPLRNQRRPPPPSPHFTPHSHVGGLALPAIQQHLRSHVRSGAVMNAAHLRGKRKKGGDEGQQSWSQLQVSKAMN